MADADELGRVVRTVLPAVVDGGVLVVMGVHERQGPVAHDEEAGREEERGQH